MISYLSGQIVASRTGFLVVKTGGVGYGVNVTANTVKKNGEKYEVFIHEHLREDCHDLYGFSTFGQLDLFEKLISVNGIGPKAGLNIMNAGTESDIIAAILTDNIAFFMSISGIGKKAAAKIILDLKSKLNGDRSINVLSDDDETNDILEALTQLGYKKPEIMAAIAKVPSEIKTIEEKVRWCLQKMAKN